jgi:hypothetical protein
MAELFWTIMAVGGVITAIGMAAGLVIFVLICEGISEGGIGAPGTKATKDEMLETIRAMRTKERK